MLRKVLLAVLLVAVGVEAQAAVLCKDKTTKALFVRAKCKASEKQVNPVALGLQTGLVLYDANDKKVGAVVDVAGLTIPVVIFRANEHVFALEAIRNRLLGRQGLLFSSTDCSGAPLFDFEAGGVQGFDVSLLPTTAIGPPGSTVYIPDPNAVAQSVLTQSFLDQVGECIADGFMRTVVPALPIVDLDTQFTPPFSVK